MKASSSQTACMILVVLLCFHRSGCSTAVAQTTKKPGALRDDGSGEEQHKPTVSVSSIVFVQEATTTTHNKQEEKGTGTKTQEMSPSKTYKWQPKEEDESFLDRLFYLSADLKDCNLDEFHSNPNSVQENRELATHCPKTCCGGTVKSPKACPSSWHKVKSARFSGMFYCAVTHTGTTAPCPSWTAGPPGWQVFHYMDSLPHNLRCFASASCPGARNLEGMENDITIPVKKHKDLAAFVRVPKTGSTSMLQFVRFANNTVSWPMHLSQTIPEDDPYAQASSCVFGNVPSANHLGANAQNETLPWSDDCPHIPYPGLVKQWSKTLDLWEPPQNAVFEEDAVLGNFSFGLQAFSMVRDPFDRLVSYFYYLRKFSETDEFLSHTVTPAQYERVKIGDLYGFMELLHLEGGGLGLELPFQYKYFHHDLDTAIKLIQDDGQGNGPKIFTMVTECYEPSLHLFAEAFEGFDQDQVHRFVASPEYTSNENKKSITHKGSYSDLPNGLDSLRELAEEWFLEDFVFYDAAVEQFQKYMDQSSLDQSLFEGCVFHGK